MSSPESFGLRAAINLLETRERVARRGMETRRANAQSGELASVRLVELWACLEGLRSRLDRAESMEARERIADLA